MWTLVSVLMDLSYQHQFSILIYDGSLDLFYAIIKFVSHHEYPPNPKNHPIGSVAVLCVVHHLTICIDKQFFDRF